MKQILLISLCLVLSPTRKIIDWRTNNISPAQRGKRLRNWNKYLFSFELLLVVILNVISSFPFWLKWLLLIYSYSRCNEIAYAFYKDVFSRLKKEKPKSNLNSVDRIKMGIKSYLGLIINFALLYFLIPSVNLIYCSDFFKMELQCSDFFTWVYFSGVTLTTLGYGDITPIHLLSQFLVLYEVLVGILLIVVVIATYIGGVSTVEKKEEEQQKIFGMFLLYLLKKSS